MGNRHRGDILRAVLLVRVPGTEVPPDMAFTKATRHMAADPVKAFQAHGAGSGATVEEGAVGPVEALRADGASA